MINSDDIVRAEMKNDVEPLASITRQFLCSVPIKEFNWHNVFENISEETQENLLTSTVKSELVLKCPVQINYQKSFVKYILHQTELQGSVIHDGLYEAYGRLVALPSENSLIFKHYCLKNTIISLKENINLISDGTTGLRTWQASLALAEWALKHKNQLTDKILLELGSGIGLTGLTVALCCAPSTVYLTDCHPTVLYTLCENLQLNIDNFNGNRQNSSSFTSTEIRNGCLFRKTLNSCVISVLSLPWQEVDEDFCRKIGKIHVILAADVVYDTELFAPLISAVQCLFKYCAVQQIVFACTERNKDTLDQFLQCVGAALFAVEELEVPEQHNFVWPSEPPVRIFRFRCL